ncbi:protein shisa-4-like [Ptychodera flava]|uniref:protein shisa-4-like n=1 Tax=Ptychodera flava TaxID=63121 RepID=UPI00396AA0B6
MPLSICNKMAIIENVLRILVALASAIALSSAGGEYCDGYHDKDGEWHYGFDCDHGFNVYCCGTWQNKTCCPYEGKYEENPTAAIIGIIVASVIAVLVFIVSTVVVCICVCCIVRASRRQQAQQTVVVGATQMTTMSTQRTASTAYPSATYPTPQYNTQRAFPTGIYPTQQYTNQSYYPQQQQDYPRDQPPQYPGKL